MSEEDAIKFVRRLEEYAASTATDFDAQAIRDLLRDFRNQEGIFKE